MRQLYTYLATVMLASPIFLYAQSSANEGEQNFAQKLGGNSIKDYADGPNFLTERVNKSDKHFKSALSKVTYKSYEEAYENLPKLPELTQIDTREEMTSYENFVVEVYIEAVAKHEPHDAFEAARKKHNEEKRAHAKSVNASQSIDPNAERYKTVVKRVNQAYQMEYGEVRDVVDSYNVSDEGEKEWLTITRGCRKALYSELAPLAKQIASEWYASEACKKVQEIEDGLMERAQTESSKKTPKWFVDGRKREGEIITEYNRQALSRWIEKIAPRMEQKKAQIPNMIECNNQIDDIFANGSVTNEYLNAKSTSFAAVEQFFFSYYELLKFIQYCPIVRTPETLEGKKFIYKK